MYCVFILNEISKVNSVLCLKNVVGLTTAKVFKI